MRKRTKPTHRYDDRVRLRFLFPPKPPVGQGCAGFPNGNAGYEPFMHR
jgi:hypothetical protein